MDALLYQTLRSHLVAIDRQIQEVSDLAQQMSHDQQRKLTPSQIQNNNGEFILTPLLVAKAQTLNAIALLKTQK